MRILIADDHGLVRAGLRALLNREANLQVVGEAADGYEALQMACELRPDIVLLDISMPGLDGIEVTRRLKADHPQMRVVILTVHEDDGLLQESIKAGAAGYIVKRAIESELLDALRAVCLGHMYVHPIVVSALVGRPAAQASVQHVEPLTPREQEVLEKVARGYTNRQIAEEWTLSVRTIESHRANLMAKLNLRSRVQLVRYAEEHGYL